MLGDANFRFKLDDDDDDDDGDDFFEELDLLELLLDFDDDEDLVKERRGVFSLSSTSPVQWTIFLPSGDDDGESG